MDDTFIWVGSQEVVINDKIDYACMCSRAGNEAEGKGEEKKQSRVKCKDSISNGDDVDRAEQSRAEQSRAEQSRAEQSRAEQRKDCTFL